MINGAKSSIGASAVALTPGSNPLTYGVSIKAAAANTGKVYVGLTNAVTANTTDATDGYELSASEEFFLPKVAFTEQGLTLDTSNVFLIASTTGQKVFFAGI